MSVFTIDDIRSWHPCYDPSRHLPEGWSGDAFDILRMESIPAEDRLWVVCRENVIDARTLRLFAVSCVRQVQHLLMDQRSHDAIVVAERFANGKAGAAELAAARAAAAAAAAAGAAAVAAAWAAAAAVAAAWDAAAARDAAGDAARDAAGAAAAARAAAQRDQIQQLAEMLSREVAR